METQLAGQPRVRGRAGRQNEDLGTDRCRLAQALGAMRRRLSRRSDLTPSDELVCSLTAEALARLSRLLRGPAGASAREVLEHAPPDIRHEVMLLAGVGSRKGAQLTGALQPESVCLRSYPRRGRVGRTRTSCVRPDQSSRWDWPSGTIPRGSSHYAWIGHHQDK